MLGSVEKTRSEAEQAREITVGYGKFELCPSWHLEVQHDAATKVLQHPPHGGNRLPGLVEA